MLDDHLVDLDRSCLILADLGKCLRETCLSLADKRKIISENLFKKGAQNNDKSINKSDPIANKIPNPQ